MGKRSKKNAKPQKEGPVRKSLFPAGLLPYLILAAILLLFSFIRIRLAPFPLERDEGEYAYQGQLLLQGIAPYRLAYDMKFPGIYAVYALIMAVFGQTAEGIRFGLLVFDLGSLGFIFLIMRRLFSSFSALTAVAAASILFISPNLLGQAAHATHFVAFFMLAGSWLLLEGLEKRRRTLLLLSGVMMGLTLLIKQSAVFLPAFGGMVAWAWPWLRKERKWTSLLASLGPYALGVAIPLLLTLLSLSLCGVFDKFWFWTLVYPKVYSSRVPLSQAWGLFSQSFPRVFHAFPAAWILAALGGVALFLYRGKPFERLLLGLMPLFSFLTTVPGLYFRQHYFITMAPAVGMLAGFLLEYLDQRIGRSLRPFRWVSALVMAGLVIQVLNENKAFYFRENPEHLCHSLYGGNPFVEAAEVARYIEANSKRDDRILVLGSEPEIYFYAKRRAATGYIYMYDFAFAQPYKERMLKELTSEVEKSGPKFLVVVMNQLSWLPERGETDALFAWFEDYARRGRYVAVGLVNYWCPEPSEFLWGKEAAARPRSQSYIHLLQKQK